MPCLIRRGPMGALCGYVAVEPGHPAHGVDGDRVDVDVHGGITYSAACHGEICHVPQPGEPDDVWWLGFDCAHGFDLVPGLRLFTSGTYRNINYVTCQVNHLAEQLRATKP